MIDLTFGSFDYQTFNSFVDYFTSVEFRHISKIKKLTIYLDNSVFELQKVYNNIIRLYTEYPREVIEISMYSVLNITYNKLIDLLIKTNYNTLNNIFMRFNIKSILKDKELEQKLECDISNIDKNICIKNDNIMNLYKIKRNKNIMNMIINIMMNLSKKNKNIMKYNIYTNIEKFLCPKEKKTVIIHFK